MGAGRYPNRLTIQSQTYSAGSDGGLVADSPVTQYTRWARIDSVSGGEAFRFAQNGVTVTHRVELRKYLSGITEQMEVVHGSRTFDIKAVMQDETCKRWTRLICEERK